MLNSQYVLRNDVTSYCLARWVWDLFWVEFVFFFIVLAPDYPMIILLFQDTLFSCCADGQTAARGSHGEGCPEHIYGCDRHGFGCCPDGVTSAEGPNNEGCPSKISVAVHVDCAQTEYGCCADSITAASGTSVHIHRYMSKKDQLTVVWLFWYTQRALPNIYIYSCHRCMPGLLISVHVSYTLSYVRQVLFCVKIMKSFAYTWWKHIPVKDRLSVV